jgi:hypothetical protein
VAAVERALSSVGAHDLARHLDRGWAGWVRGNLGTAVNLTVSQEKLCGRAAAAGALPEARDQFVAQAMA